MNRVLTSKIATWHFTPTEKSRQNLLRDGIPNESIFVTGNTVIDALLYVSKHNVSHQLNLDKAKKLILITSPSSRKFWPTFP